MRILGIDPGLATTGFGLLDHEGRTTKSIRFGTFRPKRDALLSSRLLHLFESVNALLSEESPDALVLEQAFYGKNIQSALRLGEARGVILVAAAKRGVPLYEYPAASVKKTVTGDGGATKEQVQYMVQRTLALAAPPTPFDAADALALALTFALDPAREGPLAGSSAGRFKRS